MKNTHQLVFLALPLLITLSFAEPAQKAEIPNKFIDSTGFSNDAQAAMKLRAKRRLTEDQFIQYSTDKNTILLDTRSAYKFKNLHIKGAVNLNFSDITEDTLKRIIPSKNTRILIYCNNNFEGEEKWMPTKSIRAPLNIPTFITLYSYGYKNIYELGPVLDADNTKVEWIRK